MEVNSAAAILTPSTPTFGQLELLAAYDDGAIKRDAPGPSLTDGFAPPLPQLSPPTAPPTSDTCVSSFRGVAVGAGNAVHVWGRTTVWLQERKKKQKMIQGCGLGGVY